jgi:hypothetical protein
MARVIAQEPWFFDFVEDDDGAHRLTVCCGTVAVYEVTITLTAAERRFYVEEGRDVRELAQRVVDDPRAFIEREKQRAPSSARAPHP